MCKAKNLVTSIEVDIDAPASLVWEVLTDLERYPQWNPFCPRIESTLKLGDPVHMHISVPGTSETQPVSETLVACKPQRLLGSDRCRYVTTDIFLGVNADEIMRNHGGWVKAGFDAMALALKARAEALHGGSR